MSATARRAARRRRTPDLFAGFWFVTSLVAGSGLVLAGICITIDKLGGNAGSVPILVISPDSARTILGSVAGSLITIASLTSSLTIVTLQLLSSQYTPRSVRGFLSTRLSQFVLGTFIGIFLYCLVVLVAVREPGDENEPFVPTLSILVAVLLAVVGLAVLVVFIHAMSQTIQVSTMTARIARDTAQAIDRVHPADQDAVEVPDPPAGQGPPLPVRCVGTGYVRGVDVALLVTEASGPCRVRILVRPGDFVTPASTIAEARVVGDRLPAELERQVRHCVDVQRERDLRVDPAYGVRQLVDIALRALSPGINDPTTAITCLGYLRGLLESLAARDLPEAEVAVQGDVVVAAVLTNFAEHLAPITEVAAYAGPDARVVWTLLDALADIARSSSDPERSHTVLEARDQIRRAAVADSRLELERERLVRDDPTLPIGAAG